MKTCTTCAVEKPVTEFSWRNINVRRRAQCRTCCGIADKAYRAKNKEALKKKKRNRIDAKQHRLMDFLKTQSCRDCGESNTVVLVFHHKDPATKTDSVSSLITHRYSWSRVLEEIRKCVCLCANCHMIRHFEMGHQRKHLRS